MDIEEKKLIDLKNKLRKIVYDINMLQLNNDRMMQDECKISSELEQKKRDKRIVELEQGRLKSEQKRVIHIIASYLITTGLLIIFSGFCFILGTPYNILSIASIIFTCMSLYIETKLELSKLSEIKESIIEKNPKNLDDDIEKLQNLKDLHEKNFSIEINENNKKIEELKTRKAELKEQIISLLTKTFDDSNVNQNINSDELEYNSFNLEQPTCEKVKKIGEKTL